MEWQSFLLGIVTGICFTMAFILSQSEIAPKRHCKRCGMENP